VGAHCWVYNLCSAEPVGACAGVLFQSPTAQQTNLVACQAVAVVCIVYACVKLWLQCEVVVPVLPLSK
jgi:hypothetical protein